MFGAGFPVFALLTPAFLVLAPAGTGLAAIISGLRRWNRTRRPTGTAVVDNQVKSRRRGFLPVVILTTRSGHEVRTVPTRQSGNRSHPPGTQQPVAPDPGQLPGTAGALLAGPVLLFRYGVALFLVGITFLSPGGILTGLP